ncbi:MAG: transcription-repair coupling factor, partial [Oceanobacter sp.]
MATQSAPASEQSSSLMAVMTPDRAGQRHFWGNLQGASLPLAIAEAAQKYSGPTLVIASDSLQALQLEEEIAYFSGSLPVMVFPDREVLPYDVFSPHQDITSQRIATLTQLQQQKSGILIIPATTLLHKLPPQSFFHGQSFALDTGNTFDVERSRKQLEEAGYQCVDTVYEHGEFAVRGAIVDIFPMGQAQPFRIDLFDDEIDSLRTFDPETQRTLEKVDSIRILPAREYPLNSTAIRTFKARWFDFFEQNPNDCSIYMDIGQGIAPGGIEYYLPLFFTEELGSFFDHLPPNTLVIHAADLEDKINNFREDTSARYESRRHNITQPILAPGELFLSADQLFSQLNEYPRVQWHNTSTPDHPLPDRAGAVAFDTSSISDVSVDSRSENPLARLSAYLKEKSANQIIFCAESTGRREALRELLSRIKITPTELQNWGEFSSQQAAASFFITVAPLSQGFEVGTLSLITENELFGQRIRQTRRQKKQTTDIDLVIRDLSELKPGA